ncbi:MAG: hypothetical protein VKJ64_17640 [Leptolyngbyaceae bacterium]|nr:hypothetical protein [Leptolyngbyaceae bacterium]
MTNQLGAFCQPAAIAAGADQPSIPQRYCYPYGAMFNLAPSLKFPGYRRKLRFILPPFANQI